MTNDNVNNECRFQLQQPRLTPIEFKRSGWDFIAVIYFQLSRSLYNDNYWELFQTVVLISLVVHNSQLLNFLEDFVAITNGDA